MSTDENAGAIDRLKDTLKQNIQALTGIEVLARCIVDRIELPEDELNSYIVTFTAPTCQQEALRLVREARWSIQALRDAEPDADDAEAEDWREWREQWDWDWEER